MSGKKKEKEEGRRSKSPVSARTPGPKTPRTPRTEEKVKVKIKRLEKVIRKNAGEGRNYNIKKVSVKNQEGNNRSQGRRQASIEDFYRVHQKVAGKGMDVM